MVIARSLKDAARLGGATTSLLLRRSEDLVCQNLMCAKIGEACVCRLAVHLSRLGKLTELDVAENDLGVLPEPVFELPALEHLDVSGNGLKDLPASVAALSSLRTLRLSDNALTALPKELALLPLLTEVHVDGNNGLGSSDRVVEALRNRPQTTVVLGDAGDDSRRRQDDASTSSADR
ncbi:unnamed protein product [Ectocarpus sp. 12 AP-2014]